MLWLKFLLLSPVKLLYKIFNLVSATVSFKQLLKSLMMTEKYNLTNQLSPQDLFNIEYEEEAKRLKKSLMAILQNDLVFHANTTLAINTLTLEIRNRFIREILNHFEIVRSLCTNVVGPQLPVYRVMEARLMYLVNSPEIRSFSYPHIRNLVIHVVTIVNLCLANGTAISDTNGSNSTETNNVCESNDTAIDNINASNDLKNYKASVINTDTDVDVYFKSKTDGSKNIDFDTYHVRATNDSMTEHVSEASGLATVHDSGVSGPATEHDSGVSGPATEHDSRVSGPATEHDSRVSGPATEHDRGVSESATEKDSGTSVSASNDFRPLTMRTTDNINIYLNILMAWINFFTILRFPRY